MFSFTFMLNAQIANYVNNGGFEKITPAYSVTTWSGIDYWTAIDSTKGAFLLYSTGWPYSNAPYSSAGFQFPRNGMRFIGSVFYCHSSTCGIGNSRWYPKNRLKAALKPNTVYCAKYHVVNTNNNVVGIDSYGMYFGNASLDTIKICTDPITYLSPQVVNQTGFITDTMNWIPISGTFTANGGEKYMVLGNFKSNAATNTMVLNPTYLPSMANDIYIDDVSLIEMDLPAYAGPDKDIKPGDSVYVGRPSDVGIDESCMWYKLPTVITSTTPALDTVAGIWVKPVATTTYVVKQQLWCSGIKWDTVVVYMNLVGIEKLKFLTEELQIYPIPAQDFIELSVSNFELIHEFNRALIYNSYGILVKQEEIYFDKKTLKIRIEELSNGIYFLELKDKNGETINKRFVIDK